MGLSDILGWLGDVLPRRTYEYHPIPGENAATGTRPRGRRDIASAGHTSALKVTAAAVSLVIIAYIAVAFVKAISGGQADDPCDTPEHGFQCSPSISHFWGQYSPYFSVPSEIDASTPEGCDISFAQVLSRHGARAPTASKTVIYNSTITHIHASVSQYGKGYEFIKDYHYTLGADQLSPFGQQQMINSGIQFYERYITLARSAPPFVRASGQERVVESAQNWTQGFHQAKLADKQSTGSDSFPYDILVIPEAAGVNNTLSHALCTAYETGVYSNIGTSAQRMYMGVLAPPITARLNANLPGANLSDAETIHLMDLCPFETVAPVSGTPPSPFCALFTAAEWRAYDYFQSLGKWYGIGPGNPLGPTQGVGWANELIARLTGRPVRDRTSTNATLDSSEATFPLGRQLYADLSHDNDMTGVFGALGLYAATPPLSNKTQEAAERMGGYAASWTVPFAARMYVEKMRCAGGEEELVRILVNDRVIPLPACGADTLGRCTLTRFVEGLSFAREGGLWDLCFV